MVEAIFLSFRRYPLYFKGANLQKTYRKERFEKKKSLDFAISVFRLSIPPQTRLKVMNWSSVCFNLCSSIMLRASYKSSYKLN